MINAIGLLIFSIISACFASAVLYALFLILRIVIGGIFDANIM